MNTVAKFFATAVLALGSLMSYANIAILPKPQSVVNTAAGLDLPQGSALSISGKVSSGARNQFKNILSQNGFKATSSAKAKLTLVTDKSLPAEGYTLSIGPTGITVKASTDAGFFYAAQTLDQILQQSRDGVVEGIEIADAPRYGYRGFMIDVSRCYQPVDSLKKLIDEAARLKINNVHLHLTDDNGWRLEIKKYPKLTEVGAWRVDREEMFPARRNPERGEPATYGGYYTQREMRDLVKYAAERHVNIIPEIEMPAHAVAAMASYPELSCQVDTSFIGVLPGIGGYDAQIIACAGNEKTFKFYEDVLTEVMDIFPSPYIHLGGDEADKTRWKQCELCNKRIADENLKGYEELQAYFMDRINHFVRENGRTAIGWDEVTYGNPSEDMVIMGWQGDGKVAVNYAGKTGRKFIMTPAKKLYLIRYQGPQWFEPFTYFGNNTLSDVYNYEAVESDWTPAMKNQLMGIQASMWTEFCREPADVQYMVFPRLAAMADAAWRPEGSADWPYFLRALDTHLPSMERNGITYARSMYNLDHEVAPTADGSLELTLSCIRPDVEIRYADNEKLNGYTLYTEPIKLTDDATIYAATFRNGEQQGATLALPVAFNKATAKTVKATGCSNALQQRLTNGVRGSNRNSDFEWAGWHNGVAEFVVDLGRTIPVKRVTVGNMANINLCIAAPAAIYVYTSENGTSYKPAGSITPSKEEVYPAESTVTDFTINTPSGTKARYVKVVAVNPGAVPDGMPREGAPTWIYFDEIIVN